MNNLIKKYFENNKNPGVESVYSFLKNNKNIDQYVENILEKIPEYESKYRIIKFILNDKTLPKCLNCGKYILASKAITMWRRGGYNYCNECNKLPEVRKTIRLNGQNQFQQTNLKKYGVKFPAQSKLVQKHCKETCMKKYGVDHVTKVKLVKEKIKNTILKKYNVSNIAKLNKLKNILSYNEYVEPLFNVNEYLNDNSSENKVYKWKCKKCGNIFEDYIHKTMHIKNFPYLPRCLKCYPYLAGTSNIEKEIANFCKQYFPNLKSNDRLTIHPYELDVYIPEKNIAFEFNGSFYHSINDNFKDPNYHLMKTKLCEEKGIKLIHIWEHNWINKNLLMKEKIKALLGVDQKKIYARNCIIKNIEVKEKNNFLNANHIQGEDKSSIKLGLYYQDELVAVMTFGKPRFNKNYEYELIRYATKSGNHVLGGSGKLLKYFERNYKPSSIITYADRCYSQGNMYRKIGFNELTPSKPSYFYTNNKILVSRYDAQKHKLLKLLGDKFNKDLTESENMIKAGFYKIYDCGNLVFEKIY